MRYWLVVIIASCLLGCDKPDTRLATPKGAAKTLYQAMYDNDLATAKACVIAGPGQTEIVEGMTSFMAATRRATDAAYQRFGDEYRKLLGPSLDPNHIDPKQIDEASETINGDSATIVISGEMTMHLAREKKGWKVDLVKSSKLESQVGDPKMIKVVTAMFAGMTRAADQTKTEIEAGKYPSARPAMEGLAANMKKAIKEEQERALRELLPH
jgi:hypothetical protein